MLKNHRRDTPANDAKARQLVEYAREQAEPALQANPACEQRELPEDVFPGYTIVANVSRGGQGRVYEATDNSTERRVAIKVLHSGPFGGESERLRFEREIQILAQLQHPHIVTIHSSGTVALQRYFVMDFIEGQALDEYFAGHHLTIEQTLTLFLRICEAVNAAHLRGIVHRDLKPGNVRIDDHGEPHVLDFGLAKTILDPAAGPPDPSGTTLAGQFVGSLPWAAPEQVMNAPEAVDLRTDVYGLGLLLYFMLTNSFPYDRRANLRDMMDSILRSEPTPPRSLRREIDDELSTIVLMCLRKDPARRYQIASELARDIERYRAGEPIEAKRDSAGYLLAKTLRRHRGLAVMTTAFLLITLGYAVTMSFLYQSATASGQLAEERAADVSEHYAVTQDTMGFVVNEVSSNLDRTPGNTRVRRDILEGVFKRLLPLTQEHSDDPELREYVMRIHYQLGDIAIALGRDDDATTYLQTALELRCQLPKEVQVTPRAQAELSIHYVLLGDAAQHRGDLATSERYYRLALAIDERLVADDPGNAHFQDNLAWSYDRIGLLAAQRGDPLVEEAFHRKQLHIMRQLVEGDPDNATRLHGLATALGRLGMSALSKGDGPRAADHFRQAVDIGRRGLDVDSDDSLRLQTHAMRVLAFTSLHRAVDPNAEPDTRILEAWDIAKRLVQLEPELPRSWHALAATHFHSMHAAAERQDPESTERHALGLLSAIDAYLEITSQTSEIAWMQSSGHLSLANVRRAQGHAAEADDAFRRAVTTVEEALSAGVDAPVLRIFLAELLQDDPAATDDDRVAAIDAARLSVVSVGSRNPMHIANVGRLYQAAGDLPAAVEMLKKAQAAYEELGVVFPEDHACALRECRSAARE